MKYHAHALVSLLIFGLSLAGCADNKLPNIQTQPVSVPVAVHCSTTVAIPIYPDTDQTLKNLPFPSALTALKKNPKDLTARAHVEANVYYLIKLLTAGRVVRNGYIDQLETALNGCK